jgi:hypothetical protein
MRGNGTFRILGVALIIAAIVLPPLAMTLRRNHGIGIFRTETPFPRFAKREAVQGSGSGTITMVAVVLDMREIA